MEQIPIRLINRILYTTSIDEAVYLLDYLNSKYKSIIDNIPIDEYDSFVDYVLERLLSLDSFEVIQID